MYHIIDNHPMLRELFEAILDDAGFSSRSFESAENYLHFVHSSEFESPAAILSDISMPGMTGYDLVLEIRKIHPLQKIILTTGDLNDEVTQHAQRHLYHTLAKPFRPEKLINLIHSL